MKAGPYEISVYNHGMFRLDGGAMFGSVPKTLWEREAPPDDKNRILLATRSLIVDWGDRRMMLDVGCGDKWTEKTRAIFCISEGRYVPVAGVTDLVLTHLHFDHAGGVSRIEAGTAVPNYPGTHHYVLSENVENARNPHMREKASYVPEDVGVLDQVEHTLLEDGDDVWPGITVHRSDGHTRGLGWVRVVAGGLTFAYPADLIPTSKHLPVLYVMGYDMCAETSMREKEDFLRRAVEEDWIVVFEHDPEIAAGKVGFDERGRAFLKEEVNMSDL